MYTTKNEDIAYELEVTSDDGFRTLTGEVFDLTFASAEDAAAYVAASEPSNIAEVRPTTKGVQDTDVLAFTVGDSCWSFERDRAMDDFRTLSTGSIWTTTVVAFDLGLLGCGQRLTIRDNDQEIAICRHEQGFAVVYS